MVMRDSIKNIITFNTRHRFDSLRNRFGIIPRAAKGSQYHNVKGKARDRTGAPELRSPVPDGTKRAKLHLLCTML